MGAGLDRWSVAWLTLSLMLGLHVVDEAANGTFALYRDFADWIEVFFPFVEFPAFRYYVWLINLSGAVLVLVALTWLVAKRRGPMRLASYALAAFAAANATLHVAMSLAAAQILPGTLSSPLVLAAALFLLVSIPRSS
jgi:hypothetical protein